MAALAQISDAEAWRAFRKERETRLAEPYGWLTPVALHWLDAEPQAIARLPGRWATDGRAVQVELPEGAALLREGAPLATGSVVSLSPNTRVRAGALDVEVLGRDGQVGIRIRDPEAATLAAFGGVPVFEYDPSWQVSGEFVPHADPVTVRLGSVVASLGHTRSAPGVFRFVRDGVQASLLVTQASYGPQLLFRDATSGIETYGALRQVDISLPEGGGKLSVDFNRAVNLPCAFTDFCTCPLPPPENALPFPVRAGEKSPR